MAGKKGRSGRKKKAEELGLQSLLDRAWPEAKRLAFFKMLADKAVAGDIEAGKLLAAYYYGKPVDNVRHHGGVEISVVYGNGNEAKS